MKRYVFRASQILEREGFEGAELGDQQHVICALQLVGTGEQGRWIMWSKKEAHPRDPRVNRVELTCQLVSGSPDICIR